MGRPVTWTDERIATLVHRFNLGFSVAHLADEEKVTKPHIYQLLRKGGIVFRKPKETVNELMA